MKSELVIVKKENFLYYTLSGKYDKNDFMLYPKMVADDCEKENIYNVLIHALKVKGTNLPTMDRYFLGETIAKILGPKIKLAIVWPGEHINKFTENVAVNRGTQLLIVGDFETAKEWLLTER